MLRHLGLAIHGIDGALVQPQPLADGFAASITGARFVNLLAVSAKKPASA
jgi:hypothetical protein